MKIAGVKRGSQQTLLPNYKTQKEIADVEQMLNEKAAGWDEFILYRKIKKTNAPAFVVRHADKLAELPKFQSMGNLMNWLNKYHTGWERFVIGNDRYFVVNFNECEVGMLVRQGVKNSEENLAKELNMVIEKTAETVTVNQEGNKTTFSFEKNKNRYFMEILCNQFDTGSFVSIFGEAESWSRNP